MVCGSNRQNEKEPSSAKTIFKKDLFNLERVQGEGQGKRARGTQADCELRAEPHVGFHLTTLRSDLTGDQELGA